MCFARIFPTIADAGEKRSKKSREGESSQLGILRLWGGAYDAAGSSRMGPSEEVTQLLSWVGDGRVGELRGGGAVARADTGKSRG